jgi:opacity protein-like surface antigen
MRKTILAAVALAAFSVPAYAADLSVAPLFKAPVSDQELYNWSASGWIIELGTYAGVDNASTNGNTLLVPALISSNVNASGGGVEVGGGYIHGNTNVLGFGNWYLLEAKAAYQNIQGGTSVPGDSSSFWSRWSVTEDACVGADVVTALTSVIGNLGVSWPTWTPSLPANVQVGIPKQCLGVQVREFGLGGQFGGAGGTTTAIAPGLITQFIYPTLTTTGKPNGGAIKLWASADFTTKDLELTNLFGKTGLVGINPSVSQNKTYLAGVDFAMPVTAALK